MTGNQDSNPPKTPAHDDAEKAQPATSGPPPPPVRTRSLPPPPPRAASLAPPPPQRAPRHEPPPPPKRTSPSAPSSVVARATTRSVPPPLPSTPRRLPSTPPPLPSVPPPLPPLFNAEPAHAEPAHAEPAHAEPAHAEPATPTTLPSIEAAAPIEVSAPVKVSAPIEAVPAPVPELQAAPPPEPLAAPEPELPTAPEPEHLAAAAPELMTAAAPAPAAAPEPEPELLAAPEPAPPPLDSDPIQESEIASAVAHAAPVEAEPFSSAGSDMPVVLTTPIPHVPERAAPHFANLLSVGRELLPRAQSWSRKTLRATPRALVITAPFIALFGIWAARGLVTHHPHRTAQLVQPKSATTYPSVEVMTPAKPPVTSLASAFIPAPSAVPAAAPAPVATAESAEITRATARGLPALEALATKFPGDAAVAVALASQQARAQRFEAAVATVDHLLTIAPDSAQNGKVMGILWRAAQSPASEQSFASLRKLGGRGTDIAFDLAITAGVRDAVRERAKSELTNYLAFDASDDTRVATALLLAPDCSTRKSLLERAEREGGKRTHAILDSFARGSGCASSSEGACNSCMMGSPVLAHALAHLAAGGRP